MYAIFLINNIESDIKVLSLIHILPEMYWSCSGIPGDLSASICLPHIVLLLQSAVVFDIITGTCDYQDLRNKGLKQKV